MHAYATSVSERPRKAMWLGVAAVLFAFGLDRILKALGWTVPWYVDIPGPMAFFGALYGLYDKLLWRLPVAGAGIPYLAGTWAGRAASSHEVEVDVVVWVVQTWNRMSITLETSKSSSQSATASLMDAGHQFELSYSYRNSPKALATPDTMHAHIGLAVLRVDHSLACATGDYFTGRDRGNYGEMRLRKVSKKVLKREAALAALAATPVEKKIANT